MSHVGFLLSLVNNGSKYVIHSLNLKSHNIKIFRYVVKEANYECCYTDDSFYSKHRVHALHYFSFKYPNSC